VLPLSISARYKASIHICSESSCCCFLSFEIGEMSTVVFIERWFQGFDDNKARFMSSVTFVQHRSSGFSYLLITNAVIFCVLSVACILAFHDRRARSALSPIWIEWWSSWSKSCTKTGCVGFHVSEV